MTWRQKENEDRQLRGALGVVTSRPHSGVTVTAASGANAALAELSNKTMAGQCETQDVGIDSLRSMLTLHC